MDEFALLQYYDDWNTDRKEAPASLLTLLVLALSTSVTEGDLTRWEMACGAIGDGRVACGGRGEKRVLTNKQTSKNILITLNLINSDLFSTLFCI